MGRYVVPVTVVLLLAAVVLWALGERTTIAQEPAPAPGPSFTIDCTWSVTPEEGGSCRWEIIGAEAIAAAPSMFDQMMWPPTQQAAAISIAWMASEGVGTFSIPPTVTPTPTP